MQGRITLWQCEFGKHQGKALCYVHDDGVKCDDNRADSQFLY